MKAFRLMATLAIALCFVVVVFGAYVRLSDAGLGCPDWPGCYGRLAVPAQLDDAAQAEFGRPLEHAKAWKEMLHRYLASTLGLLIVAMAGLALARRDLPRALPLALVVLVVFQGLLGMWTVTLLLKPLIVTAHLLGGMTTLALLLWLRLTLSAVPPIRAALRPWAALSLLLLVGQIFLGGWTSSNYAALACIDFPTCHGAWRPAMDFTGGFKLWRGLGVSYEFGVLDHPARVAIHWAHRVGALVTAGASLVLGVALLARPGRSRSLGILLLTAVLLQLLLGISLVVFHLPLPVAAAHNGGAALLLMTLVAVNFHAWRRS